MSPYIKAMREKDWQRAVTLLNKAASKSPHNADIHSNLGYGYRHTKVLPLSFKIAAYEENAK